MKRSKANDFKKERQGDRLAALQMMYLIGCALRNVEPDITDLSAPDMDRICEVAEDHSLSAVTAFALRKFRMECREELLGVMVNSARRSVLMQRERTLLFTFLNGEGIPYLPLKGVILEKYYPSVGAREMSDNDILIGGEFAGKVRDWMIDNGYECRSFGKGHHDVYEKKPGFCFEIHRTVFDEDDHPLYASCFRDVFSRAIKDDDGGSGYHLSDEDFYIHHILHAKMHREVAGIGLREPVDMLVLERHLSDAVDREYIDAELKKLGADGFERELRELTDAVFAWRPGESFSSEMFDEFLLSGTYGTYDNLLHNHFRMTKADKGVAGKLRYFRYRFSVPDGTLKKKYPFFYRHKALVPLLWVYRPARKLIKRPGSIPKELRALRSYSDKNDSKKNE